MYLVDHTPMTGTGNVSLLSLEFLLYSQVDGNESGLSSDDDADSKQEDSELEEMLLEASGAGRPATRKRGALPFVARWGATNT